MSPRYHHHSEYMAGLQVRPVRRTTLESSHIHIEPWQIPVAVFSIVTTCIFFHRPFLFSNNQLRSHPDTASDSILTVPLRSSKSAHHTTAHIPFLICLSSKLCRLGCPPATERSITTFNKIFDSVEASDGTISATNGWQCPQWVVG